MPELGQLQDVVYRTGSEVWYFVHTYYVKKSNKRNKYSKYRRSQSQLARNDRFAIHDAPTTDSSPTPSSISPNQAH